MTAKLPDRLRLAIGTLTALPVAPPSRVDARVAAGSMVLAPLVGAGLGGLAALLVALGRPALPPLVLAVLGVATLAGLTRAIHLDGLADTVDGLGSGQPPPRALAVMRRGDIGPFGVVAIVLVLGLDVAALNQAFGVRQETSTLVLACMVGRLPLPLSCRRGVPAARADGLGGAVIGTVPWAGVGVALLAVAAVAGVLSMVAEMADWRSLVAALALSLAAGELVLRLAVRRLGGLTGDVLGAITELATAVALVCLVAG